MIPLMRPDEMKKTLELILHELKKQTREMCAQTELMKTILPCGAPQDINEMKELIMSNMNEIEPTAQKIIESIFNMVQEKKS